MKIFKADWLINLEKCILWQYDKAPNINGLIKEKQKWYRQNVSYFITNFFLNIFNLKTANDFGLNVWGKLLNFPRQIMLNKYQLSVEQTTGTGKQEFSVNRGIFNSKIESGDDFPAISIEEGDKYTFIFTLTGAHFSLEIKDINGNTIYTILDDVVLTDYGISVSEGTMTIGDVVTATADYTPLNLSTEQYRFLLLGQVLKFNMSATLPEINQYLRLIFNETNNNNVYVTDNHNMTISYNLAPAVLSSDIRKLIDNYDFLPAPAGVKVLTTSANYITFTIDTLPETATVKFTVDGQSYYQKSIDVEIGTAIQWEVSDIANGFDSQSGTEENLTENKTIEVVLQTILRLNVVPDTANIVLTINGTEYEATGNIEKTVNAGDSYSWTITKTSPTPVPLPTPQPQEDERYYSGDYLPDVESGTITKKIDKTIELQCKEYAYIFNSIYGDGVKSGGFYYIKKAGNYRIRLGGDKEENYDGTQRKGGSAELELQLNNGDVIEFKAIYGGNINMTGRRYIGGAGIAVLLNNNILMVAGGAGTVFAHTIIWETKDGAVGGGGYDGGQTMRSQTNNYIRDGWSIKDLKKGNNKTTNAGAGYADLVNSNNFAYGGSGYVAEEYAEEATLVYEGNALNYGYAIILYIEEE